MATRLRMLVFVSRVQGRDQAEVYITSWGGQAEALRLRSYGVAKRQLHCHVNFVGQPEGMSEYAAVIM
jgi:hypothetical protein